MYQIRSLRMPTVGRAGLAAVVLIILAAVLPLWAGPYLRSFASIVLMWAGLALAWNLISGYTGYVSFGHTAFFGVGAYVGAYSAQNYGTTWATAGVVAMFATALLALPIGWVLLRLRGVFFAVGMLGLSEIARVVVQQADGITGGGAGMYLSTPADLRLVYYAFLSIAVALFVLTAFIDRSRLGASLLAIRSDEEAASVVGVPTTLLKTAAFVVSAGFTGALGLAYAVYVSYIDPSSVFQIQLNLVILLMVVLGGPGTAMGPIVGALIVGGLREYFWIHLPVLNMLGFGFAMVATVLLFPRGVVPYVSGIIRRRRRRQVEYSRRNEPAGTGNIQETGSIQESREPLNRLSTFAEVGSEPSSAGTVILEARAVTVAYAGREVLTNCNITIRRGSITGLIGPNGSGKTTLFNIISGVLRPAAGSIHLLGRDVSKLRPNVRAHLGMARTFQLPRLFDRLSVARNLGVASPSASGERRSVAGTILNQFGIGDLGEEPVSELSYGQRKLVEIARALIQEPSIVLMDEPFAGINPVVRGLVMNIIRERNRRDGTTFLIIGHEMEDMFELCDEIVVLDQGEQLARGTPEVIKHDARVFEAYFGKWVARTPQVVEKNSPPSHQEDTDAS